MRLCENNSKPLGSRTIRMQRSNDVEEPDECRHRFLLQVLGVRLGRTVSSMSFSRKAASYFPRPRLRSQTMMSMTAPTISGGAHHLPGKRGCPGWRWGSQGFAKHAEV